MYQTTRVSVFGYVGYVSGRMDGVFPFVFVTGNERRLVLPV